MHKICLVSYYGPIESLKIAEESIQRDNFQVYDFPLFKYMYDKHDKIDNYIELFIEFIKNNNIDFVLWWFINIPSSEFIYIKEQTNVKYLFFNWDEPFNWKDCDINSKCKYFDTVFITCKETLERYNKYGCNNAYCLYPGFDINTNYIITQLDNELYNKYSCDISICCTNLYENENVYSSQYINRKKLIDDVYINQEKYNYIFYIYGPEFLKEIYPLSYRGFAKYNELNYIFNYSKINLCTHVMSNYEGYLNERVILIGGSGGLLLMDYVNGIQNIFNINKEILVLDKHFYIKQIVSILDEYYMFIDLRKEFNKKCIEQYSYKKWADFIVEKIVDL